jgi:hypothetical protein
MLAVMGIFTGMIAPGVTDGARSVPYILTNMSMLSYAILAILIITFYLVSIRRWGAFRIMGLALALAIIYLLAMTISGGVLAGA